MYYQTLRFPQQAKKSASSFSIKSDTYEEKTYSDDTLDDVCQTKNRNENISVESVSKIVQCLEPSCLFPIFLPYNLSRQNASPKWNHDSAPTKLALRIPMMAKFSLNMKFLALQFSPTLIRIVKVSPEQYLNSQQQEQNSFKKSFSSPISQKTNVSALSSFDPYENPTRSKYDSNKEERNAWTIDLAKDFPVSLDESFPENWDQVAPSTTLISNGIIW